MKYTNVVEDFFQRVIKKSWTWERLTDEERKRFIDMTVFEEIKGSNKTRTEWFCSIYIAFLCGVGYTPIGWRETQEEKQMPKF